MTCRIGDAEAIPHKAPTAKAAVFAQAVNDRNEGKRVRFQAREKDRFHRDTSILSRDNGAVPDETPARAVPRAFYMAILGRKIKPPNPPSPLVNRPAPC